MKKVLISILFIVFVFSFAQAQFSISAQLRPRAEMDNGTVKPRNDSINTFYFITQRSRINLDYNHEKYQMHFSLQDVRVWGNGEIYTPTGVFGSVNSVDVYEAWFKIRFGQTSNLTIGRQELRYDDQRLISWRNWNQYGLSYDALVFNHKKKDWEFNVGVSYNNMINQNSGKPIDDDELFNQTNIMKSFNFLRLNRKFDEHISATFLATGAGYQKTDDKSVMYMMGTFGFWAGFKYEHFDATVNAYYQRGKAQSGKDVSAWMFTANPGYKTGNLRLGLGLDYISGDDANSSDYLQKERTFNKMYGAVFAVNGWMNYFGYVESSTKYGGLLDVYPNVEFGFKEKHKVRAYYHFFSLANAVKFGGEIIENKDLGQELDLMYIYTYSKELNLQAGFSYYFTSETLDKVKGVSANNTQSPYWAWVMITFKPTLFTSK